MFAIQISRSILQSAICMLLSVIIVAAGLSIGAIGADHAALRQHYSVTVTQLS